MILKENHWNRVRTGAWFCTLIGIVTLSLLPEANPAVEYVPSVWADLAHVPAYALLTMLTILMTAVRVRMSLGILAVIVFAVSLFGGAIEILQPLTGRTASMLDTLRNIAGAVLAAWCYLLWTAWREVIIRITAAKPVPLSRQIRVSVMGQGERE